MTKRPLPVTIIACIYIAAGVVGLIYHLPDFKAQHLFQHDMVGIALLRLLAILAGVFVLRGHNWARWLAIAWIACHVAIGALHSTQQFFMHLLLLAVFAYFLFRPAATEYFRGKRAEAA
ncbi:MAG: hypothetical protein LAO20_18810 [Acidobacteriia bacterium]|nr:hypothetical protein [Terriglobia bacterium]